MGPVKKVFKSRKLLRHVFIGVRKASGKSILVTGFFLFVEVVFVFVNYEN